MDPYRQRAPYILVIHCALILATDIGRRRSDLQIRCLLRFIV